MAKRVRPSSGAVPKRHTRVSKRHNVVDSAKERILELIGTIEASDVRQALLLEMTRLDVSPGIRYLYRTASKRLAGAHGNALRVLKKSLERYEQVIK